jgi:hypothetical protein
MAPDERGWHRLYDRATEVLGAEEADELMARVPVTGWTELATKKDLEVMEHKLTATFHKELTAAITSQTRALTFQSVSLFIAFALFAWAMR